ncbi:hypothetical protein GBF35_32420 [Nonomuraea phyllanthi]|uniref:hypothetical protein n=1 Tax=Nonomuraea phyllanthi TaxID=2219224 RepID=UPI0012930DB2|nr:hypothetical protein [Nonomuraea phyllanthi]QFY10690.1 hypothetical protein GBF35_32420 [Nonomuraea phyllanthi]
MTRSLLLVPLAAGALTVPAPPPETELAISSITVRPAEPVVGPHDSVRLVIDVIARGARDRNGVTVKVEPGKPPGPVLADKQPSPETGPSADPDGPPEPSPAGETPPADGVEARPVAPAPFADTHPAGPDGTGQPAPAAAPAPRPVWTAAKPLSTARMGDGWETWRFLPDKQLTRYYPAGTWTITATARGTGGAKITEYASFQFRRDTKLSSVRAERGRNSGAVRLRGQLRRVDPRGYGDYGPFARQPLEILWRPDQSSPWTEVGRTTTDASGTFMTTVTGRTGGLWRVRYPGTGHYASDTSKPRQITQ